MNNPFDDNLKRSLEGFEMPYDATAWAELAKQLPPDGTMVGPESARFGWKGASVVAVLVAIIAAFWFFNPNFEPASEKTAIESVPVNKEVGVVELPVVETNTGAIQTANSPSENSIPSKIIVNKTTTKTVSETSAETGAAMEATVTKNQIGASPSQPKQTSASKPSITTPKPEKKPFAAKFLPSSVNVCVGEEVNFINQSSNSKANMVWEFGDGAMSSELNPNHTFVTSGIYQVRLKGIDDNQSDDHLVSVTVNPTPTIDLVPTEKLVGYMAIPYYHFETSIQANEKATWKFSDGRQTLGSDVNHLFRDAGKVAVNLSVENNLGCSSSQSWSLDHNAFDMMAPTAFTPEGNSLNETFMPIALTLLNVPFDMVIRDQKGHEVYRTSNAQEPWNGRLNNMGEKLGAGIYVWSVILKENIASRKDFNGTITIKR